ncbi:MAG: VCBS repeat-containing protein [Acidimicrobiales bacterium]|nr:VCBS repeat-containing protein [Acidimicrobiales bacterium]
MPSLRPRPAVVAVLLVALVGMSSPSAASAESVGGSPSAVASDLPPGFTDGEPVGPTDDPPAPSEAPTTSATPTVRYFGRDPWNAIRSASAATTRTCAVSDDGLSALVIAPVFKESSAATTAATAPSPMTLSRYDEWNGVYATSDNRSANYGLYAFRDPTTAYKRAFWHTGIGIWQYDTAGAGAPFTAIERMDVADVAADVAAGMAARYCSPSPSVVGHGAPFTDQERRYSAWWPWGYGCTLCEAAFQDLTSTSPRFAALALVDGISTTGGAQQRSCTIPGVSGAVTCWYVDPSVGTIEGATGWATVAPLDGGSPTVAPTPLAAPFYVIDRGATEERHWLAADTGYAIDISGSHVVGTNDRPRSNQAGSGIAWRSSSGLCDLTTGRGACVPTPPSGLTSTPSPVSGSYRAIVLDAQGDGHDDLLWVAPGPAADHLWSGQGDGTFVSTPQSIAGDFDDVLPLDVDGDGKDDIVWYARRTGTSYLWRAVGDGTWTSQRLSRPAGLRPMVVDTDGDGRDEVLWYGPGSLPDAVWSWDGGGFRSTPQTVRGTYTALAGDFTGDGKTDVLWYGPGRAGDSLWVSTGLGSHRNVAVTINGTYQPLVADLDGDGPADIVWYGPGATADSLWWGRPGGGFASAPLTVSGRYLPILADLEGDGRTDLLWYSPGVGADRWWRWAGDRSISAVSVVANGPHVPLVGTFGQAGSDSIFWYAPGAVPDGTWWR